MITVGIDVGSVATKGALFFEDQKFVSVIPTGWSPKEAGRGIITQLLNLSGLNESQVDAIIATGYGRIAVKEATRTITEISCHARGITHLNPEIRTIIDIGGQDSKVISVDSQGQVLDFAMNDKCAAGTGRFLQLMANTLELDVSELGQMEEPHQAVNITSMCTVFAESEVTGLLAQGTPKGSIIAGLHQSVGKRVATMVRRLGIKEKIAFTGGVAMNPGVKRAIEMELGHSIIVPEECQYTGAIGAALLYSKQP